MSKELKAFETVYNNIDYLICDVVIEDDKVNGCLMTIKEQLPIIKQALQRLEAIGNSNPSEALECLENIWCDISTNYVNEYVTIKQALLKAQEPKQYLKWEDLEFEELEFKAEQKKDFKVKLNGTEYGLEICITFGIKEVLIFDEKKVLYAVFHERHKQFFNDLHLEVVEE